MYFRVKGTRILPSPHTPASNNLVRDVRTVTAAPSENGSHCKKKNQVPEI